MGLRKLAGSWQPHPSYPSDMAFYLMPLQHPLKIGLVALETDGLFHWFAWISETHDSEMICGKTDSLEEAKQACEKVLRDNDWELNNCLMSFL